MRSAAREWAEHRAGKGFALPAPTALERLMAGEVQEDEVIVDIPVLLDSGQPISQQSLVGHRFGD
jgi:hypothetical protein